MANETANRRTLRCIQVLIPFFVMQTNKQTPEIPNNERSEELVLEISDAKDAVELVTRKRLEDLRKALEINSQ